MAKSNRIRMCFFSEVHVAKVVRNKSIVNKSNKLSLQPQGAATLGSMQSLVNGIIDVDLYLCIFTCIYVFYMKLRALHVFTSYQTLY